MARPATPNTRGRSALIAYLKRSKRTQAEVAKSIGVTQQTLSSWLAGKCRPTHPYRLALKRETGIADTLWLDARERALAAA